MKILFCTVLLLLPLRSATDKVVYGVDDRVEYYDAPTNLQEITRKSVVALMESAALGSPDTNGEYSGPSSVSTLATAARVCSSERFADQPIPAFCSGTLIAEDLVLTAGHCISNLAECIDTRIVFDFYYVSDGTLATIDSSSVYSCTAYLREQVTYTNGVKRDFAVLKLDRAVEGDREPVQTSTDYDDVNLSDLYDIIGFPSGLPAKILSNFPLRELGPQEGMFTGSPDTFGGNSGSGVFDPAGKHVGILVEGEVDYVTTTGGCDVVNDCSQDDCRGETMTYTAYAKEQLHAISCTSDSQCHDNDCDEGYCWGGGGVGGPASTTFLSSVLVASTVLLTWLAF
jgi:hypothetical protein